METTRAFLMGEINRNKELMVFDWIKAANLIRQKNVTEASAGLKNDWEYTGDRILIDGKIPDLEETYTYLASTWAMPQIDIDGKLYDCYIMESKSPGWNAKTFWPEEAKKILNL